MPALPRHVLVVDDDRDIRESLAALLADMGYSVSTARDGREALAVLHETTHPAVVLLDYRMPVLDGYAVLCAATSDPELSRHAFVLLTAEPNAISHPARLALDQLNAPFVEKPFDLEELLETIEGASRRPPLPPIEWDAQLDAQLLVG